MKKSRIVRIGALLASLLLASAAAAETIYKYRRADGQMLYSSRPLPGVELIETFDYRFPPAVAPRSGAVKSDAEGEARVTKYLDTLDAAWKKVQDATRALALAEERLRAGDVPLPGERQAVATDSAPPAAGGVPAPAAPAIGGSLTGRRGRPAPEYVERMQALEADVATARARLGEALRSYNQLR